MSRKLIALYFIGALAACGETTDVVGTRSTSEVTSGPGDDLLDERIGVSSEVSKAAIDTAFQQLFFGDANQVVYFESEDGSAAYIKDIANDDVRTDSMSYGMFVAVQLDEREIFDKLWSWSKKYMLQTDGPRLGQLNWRCETDGSACEQAAATDATSVIASTLFMAEARWGDLGVHDYRADANTLIDAMVLTEERSAGTDNVVVNPFDVQRALPRAGSFLDDVDVHTDYLMPAFYQYWSMWRPQDADFWLEAADQARYLLQLAPHARTGLIPRGLNYDGTPASGYNRYDQIAARTFFNLALDEVLFGPKSWVQEQTERRLDFFLSQGDSVVAAYSLSGTPLIAYDTSAHIALVALAAASSTNPEHAVFLDKLWDQPVPSGQQRYFNGMLYLLSLVVLSGNASALGP